MERRENEEIKEEILEEEILEDENSEEEDEEITELDKKNIEIEELTNRLLRLQADFTNYKNRVEKEKEKIFAYATEDIMCQLLPILDNFDRALDSVDEEDGFYQGVKMIYDQILKALNENGLEEIQCIGENFDPNFHHAVFMEESEDKEEGTVLEVLQKGYLLKDKVIRPSMVKVAK